MTIYPFFLKKKKKKKNQQAWVSGSSHQVWKKLATAFGENNILKARQKKEKNRESPQYTSDFVDWYKEKSLISNHDKYSTAQERTLSS